MRRYLAILIGALFFGLSAHAADSMVHDGARLLGGSVSYATMQGGTENSKILLGMVKMGVFASQHTAVGGEIGYGRQMFDGYQNNADQYIKAGLFADHFWPRSRESIFYRAGLGVYGEYTSVDQACGGLNPRVGIQFPFSRGAVIDLELGYQRILAGPRGWDNPREAVYMSIGLTGFSY